MLYCPVSPSAYCCVAARDVLQDDVTPGVVHTHYSPTDDVPHSNRSVLVAEPLSFVPDVAVHLFLTYRGIRGVVEEQEHT